MPSNTIDEFFGRAGSNYRLDDFLGRADRIYVDYDKAPWINLYIALAMTFDNAPALEVINEFAEVMVDVCPRWLDYPRTLPLPFVPPKWERDPDFHFANHVRCIDLGPDASEQAAWRVAEEAYCRALDPRHPRWELVYIHGLAGGRAMLLVRMHHMYMDGACLSVVFFEAFSRMMDESRKRSGAAKNPAAAADSPHHAANGHRRGNGQNHRRSIRSLTGALHHATRGAAFEFDGVRSRLRQAGSKLSQALSEANVRRQLGQELVRFTRHATEALTTRRRALGEPNNTRTLLHKKIAVKDFRSAAKRAKGGVNDILVAVASKTTSRYYEEIQHEHDDVIVVVPVDARSKQSPLVLNNTIHCALVRPAHHRKGESLKDIRRRILSALRLDQQPVTEFTGALSSLLPMVARRRLDQTFDVLPDIVTSNLIYPATVGLGKNHLIEDFFVFTPCMGSTATFMVFTYRETLFISTIVNNGIVRDSARFAEILDEEFASFGL